MAYGNGGTGTTTGYGAISGSSVAVRPSAIADQMGVLSDRTESLSQHVAELEARLVGILQPDAPMTTDKQGPQPSHPVPMAATLGQINDRLGMIAQRLRNIIDRVEL